MEDLLQVGVITSTHGIRGEVKVFPTTDDAIAYIKPAFKVCYVWRGCQLGTNPLCYRLCGG